MEVKNYQSPKKLHHHALPIVIVAIALLAASTPFVLHQNVASGNGAALIHDLSTHALKVTPASHGLGHITLNNNNSNHYVSPEVMQAGRTAELTFTLDQTHL
jgi:hypothetical protein